MYLLILFLIGKIFALILGGYYFRILSNPYKIVLFLTGIATISETSGYYISYILHDSNAWLFNIYMILEVWLMGLAAFYLIQNTISKYILITLILTNTAFWVYNIYSYSIYKFASTSMILGCIIMTIIYIMVLISNSLFISKNIFSQPVFWLCLSSLLYFGGDIPFMGLHNYLFEKNPKLGDQLVNINTILDIIRYPLLGISFILLGRQHSKPLKVAGHVQQ